MQIADEVDSGTAARTLIGETLAAVEDEMTDIPNEPANWQTDGRMYPLQADSRATLRIDLT